MPGRKGGLRLLSERQNRKAGPPVLSGQDLTGFSCIIYAVSCVGITFAQFVSGCRTAVNIMHNLLAFPGNGWHFVALRIEYKVIIERPLFLLVDNFLIYLAIAIL